MTGPLLTEKPSLIDNLWIDNLCNKSSKNEKLAKQSSKMIIRPLLFTPDETVCEKLQK